MRLKMFSILAGLLLASCANVDSPTGKGGAQALPPGGFKAESMIENVCSEDLPSIEAFACNAKMSFYGCRIQVRYELLKQPGPQAYQCIDEQRERVGSLYAKAREAAKDNERNLEDIEDLYDFWQASMGDLVRGPDEPQPLYEMKIDARWRALSERADRLSES